MGDHGGPWIAALLALGSGCGEESRSLYLDLVTDFAPGNEVDAARTIRLDSAGGSELAVVPLTETTDLRGGHRILELEGLEAGTLRLRVELLWHGDVITNRTLSVLVTGRHGATLVISRSCPGVTCPAGETCHGGRCVGEGCDEEHPERCGPPECTTADDCGAAPPCAELRCTASGVCVRPPVPAACPSGEYCDPDTGCRPVAPCPSFAAPVELAAGEDTACVLSGGRRTCWGGGRHGQRGDGSFTEAQLGPVTLDDVTAWSAISIGNGQACAVAVDGALYCWGGDWMEQLGLGPGDTPRNRPTRVGAAADWISPVAGDSTTCAFATSALRCWGDDGEGQVGDGTAGGSVPAPADVAGAFATVDVGRDHTCAVDPAGALWCWGGNSNQALGDPTFTIEPTPRRVGTDTWSQVATAWESTCAVRVDGTLWCWGQNYAGQLGIGDRDGQPTPRQVGTDSDWAQVSTRRSHACGLKRDGSLFCWGRNGHGELGIGESAGSDDYRTSPMRTLGDGWAFVAAGGSFTCALRSSGELYCWGENSRGQLGTGDTTDRLSPTPVCAP